MISITPFFHVYHKYVFIMANINKIRLSGTTYSIQDLNATKTVELTQAEYDALPATAKTSNSLFIITDAKAGDLSNYYTKSETDNAITAATSTKQDTLVSGTNIKTINNQSILGDGNIEIQGGGGGKAIEAGTNISVTTGETADTINCTLPISARADKNNGNLTNVVVGDSNNVSSGAYFTYAEGYETKATGAHGAHAEGYNTTASGQYGAHAEGWGTEARGSRCHAEGEHSKAFGNSSHAEGYGTSAMAYASHSEGWYTIANNQSEHASGQYNNSVSASTTFGDSGNTLFSVGNGTSESARHNAFEIRQNGDIYISKDGQDVKLQDQLGGGTVDTEITSASTNPVTSAAIYNQLGGLKLVKLTQSEYDSLTTKDNSILYVIVN